MSKIKNDPVNHPSHYTQGGVECIQAIEAALGPQGFIAFLRGQVLKYNWRLGHKDHPVQDAEKAQWYGALLVKKVQEDAAEPHCRRDSDTKDVQAVPPTQGEALTEKKAQSHDNSISSDSSNSSVRDRFDAAPIFRFPTHQYSRACLCAWCVYRSSRSDSIYRDHP